MALVVFFQEHEEVPKRVFRDRNNPLDYLNDGEIVERYRLSRPLIFTLLESIHNDVDRPTTRSHAIPAVTQVRFDICI